jgi:hypothetical protein
MQRLYSSSGDPGERPAVPAWVQPPQDEYPVLLPVGEVLARTAGTVLAVSALEVYSTGVVIRVDSVLRRLGETAKDWSWILHGGFGRPADPSGEELHWRVVLAEGSTAEFGGFPHGRAWDEQPEGWSLSFANGGGGGGGDERYDQHHGLWLWPLPPEGPIELVAEWRERGIPESRVTVDGAAILAAVPRVRSLWP